MRRRTTSSQDPEAAPAALVEAVDVTVVQPLRARGFAGEPPNLRRVGPNRVDLLGIHLSAEGVHILAASHRPDAADPHARMLVPGDIEDASHRLSLLVDGRAPADHAAPGPDPARDTLTARGRWQAFWPDDGRRGPRPDEALPFRHPSVLAAQVWTLIEERAMPFWEGGPDAHG